MAGGNMMKKITLGVLVTLVPCSGWASLDSRVLGERRKPPQEAFDACKDKSEGATVTITMPNGANLSATCRMFEGQLAAAPDGPPPPEPRNDGQTMVPQNGN